MRFSHNASSHRRALLSVLFPLYSCHLLSPTLTTLRQRIYAARGRGDLFRWGLLEALPDWHWYVQSGDVNSALNQIELLVTSINSSQEHVRTAGTGRSGRANSTSATTRQPPQSDWSTPCYCRHWVNGVRAAASSTSNNGPTAVSASTRLPFHVSQWRKRATSCWVRSPRTLSNTTSLGGLCDQVC